MDGQDSERRVADRTATDPRVTGDVLRRMTAAPAAQGVRLTPERALHIAFGRAARGFPEPGLRMSSCSSEQTGLAALAAAAPAEGMMTALLVRDGASGGALLADMSLVSALVEAETTGRLARSPPEARAATRLDLLVASRLLNAALAAFDEVGADLPIAAAATGWRLGALQPAPSALPLVLPEAPLRLMRLRFELGPREGQLWLATPLLPPRPAFDPPGGTVCLSPAVLAARAQVRAVLARLELPLEALDAWQPGTLLPLERAALGEVRIEDIAGATIARGRLGQVNGARAVRLSMEAAQ